MARQHPRRDSADGQIFCQPWSATSEEKAREIQTESSITSPTMTEPDARCEAQQACCGDPLFCLCCQVAIIPQRHTPLRVQTNVHRFFAPAAAWAASRGRLR